MIYICTYVYMYAHVHRYDMIFPTIMKYRRDWTGWHGDVCLTRAAKARRPIHSSESKCTTPFFTLSVKWFVVIVEKCVSLLIYSRVAQWERAGPITQRSMDRNHPLLLFFFPLHNVISHHSFCEQFRTHFIQNPVMTPCYYCRAEWRSGSVLGP